MSTPYHVSFPSSSPTFLPGGSTPLSPSFSSASGAWDPQMGVGQTSSPPLLTTIGTTPGPSAIPGSSSSIRGVEVHPAAYSDRRRLLYHITQLATQYQRAQLQVEEQQAALVLLHGHLQSLQERIQQSETKHTQKEKKARKTSRLISSSSSSLEKSREGGKERDHESEDDDEEEDEEEEEKEEEMEKDDRVHVEVHRGGLTAALLMAENEAALQKQIRGRLPYFDPLLAQTQIHRLDDALAHVSLLREAELARAQQAEEVELPPLRVACAALRKEVEVLQEAKTHWEQRCVLQEKQLQATTEEVERLRVEEVQLNHQLTVLQRFQSTVAGGPITAPPLPMRSDPTREMAIVEGGGRVFGVSSSSSSSSFSAAMWSLLVEESAARQSLWMNIFWEPMTMAFDAGLTWLLEMERRESDAQLAALEDAIREETAHRRAGYPAVVHHALRLQEEEEEEEEAAVRHRNRVPDLSPSTTAAGSRAAVARTIGDKEKEEEGEATREESPSAVTPPHPLVPRDTLQGIPRRWGEHRPHTRGSASPSGSRSKSIFLGHDDITAADADLVVLKNQQAELRDIRLQLETSKQHAHVLELEVSRWKAMYSNEKTQATQRSETHVVQLHRAYTEIVRDRQLVKATLKREVEAQVRAAFSEGRFYEQNLRSSESQTVQD